MTAVRIPIASLAGAAAKERWVAVTPPSHHKHKPTRPKLTIRGTITRDTITVPYAPQGGNRSGLAGVWARQTRPGRPDALVYTNLPTPVLALDLTFMHTDFHQDVEAALKAFRTMIAGEEAVLLSGCSPSWAGPWYVTDATEDVQDLTPRNRIAKAVVHCTFTKADKGNMDGTGPITGGVKASKRVRTHTYTVKKGDTLPGIAARELGDASLYGIIAAINNLRSTKLHPGQKLKLPEMGKGKGGKG